MSDCKSYRAHWLTRPATALQIKVDTNLSVSLIAPNSVPIVTKITETRSSTIAVSKALAISRKTVPVSRFSSKPMLTPFSERGQLQHFVRSGSEHKLLILRQFTHTTSQWGYSHTACQPCPVDVVTCRSKAPSCHFSASMRLSREQVSKRVRSAYA